MAQPGIGYGTRQLRHIVQHNCGTSGNTTVALPGIGYFTREGNCGTPGKTTVAHQATQLWHNQASVIYQATQPWHTEIAAHHATQLWHIRQLWRIMQLWCIMQLWHTRQHSSGTPGNIPAAHQECCTSMTRLPHRSRCVEGHRSDAHPPLRPHERVSATTLRYTG